MNKSNWRGKIKELMEKGGWFEYFRLEPNLIPEQFTVRYKFANNFFVSINTMIDEHEYVWLTFESGQPLQLIDEIIKIEALENNIHKILKSMMDNLWVKNELRDPDIFYDYNLLKEEFKWR